MTSVIVSPSHLLLKTYLDDFDEKGNICNIKTYEMNESISLFIYTVTIAAEVTVSLVTVLIPSFSAHNFPSISFLRFTIASPIYLTLDESVFLL